MGHRRLVRFRVTVCVAVAAAVVAVVGVAVPALASTISVRATISHPATPAIARLTISRNGVTYYDQLIRSRACGSQCALTVVPPGKLPLREAGLETRLEPNIVLGLYSGGAHCCFIDQVFSYDPGTRTYVRTEHNFLDAGAGLRRIGGQWVFLSADARIAEDALTDYADSGAPLQIWRFSHRRFVDVTRRYPSRIRVDAARWLRAYRSHQRNDVGFIAAWAADEYLLGNGALVRSTLATEARNGQLHSALGLPRGGATAFVAELEKLLRQLGYVK